MICFGKNYTTLLQPLVNVLQWSPTHAMGHGPWHGMVHGMDTITQKHWRAMSGLDPYLKEVYPEPPLIIYKRHKNFREYLIKAKLPHPGQARPFRQIKGMERCKQNCLVGPYILETKDIKHENGVWKVEANVICRTNNLVNM